ncbi:CPBP family intramembrane glutamic endopeptidase [Maribacter algicola]|uniref:CPBP family intramembrane glutamic endopeptidase n=1 Tax=Meishania litoralis TaxID=3434685 RepID=A0ACC7LM54_9FLAO
MQQETRSHYPSNAFGRFWMSVPLVIRSALIGFGITTFGVSIWGLFVEKVPQGLSFVPMGAFLVFYWMYFRGRWNPSNTKAFRRACTRRTQLNSRTWSWGLIGALSFFIFWHSFLVSTFRIVEFRPATFKIFGHLNDSSFENWSLIIMASIVAGICEEIGYRGYMQVPLERRYGPVVAISITSVVFVLIHLHQAWASGPILVLLFVISFMGGYLAFASKSLLPSIIGHVALDIVNFSYWWSDVLGTFERKPISLTGVDAHFIWSIIALVLSTGLFVLSVKKLLLSKT